MRRFALYALGLVVTALVALGLVVLSSASEANGIRLHHGDAYFFLKRQVMYLVAGLAIACVTARLDYRFWKRHPSLVCVALAVVFGLLCGVFAFPKINGSYRWIPVGPVRLQPSEFAKLVTVLALSVWFDRIAWRVELFRRGALYPAVFLGVLAAPVLFEPDFGSVMVIAAAGGLLMFVAGVKILHVTPFAIAGAGVVAAKVLSNANRMARMAAFFGVKLQIGANVVDKAAENAAYQAHQALVAIMNGGLWGVGLNQSMQKHYYLPEAHTDMIFAIGAEELGLCFSVGVLVLFCAFFAFAVYLASQAADRFGRFLVVGMAFVVFFPAMFNLGVVCEALPMKGMALPFFSYGGTNLLSAFFAVGTILSVGIHSTSGHQRQLAQHRVVLGR